MPFVIGDIHGGLLALQQVLERANIKADDQLIFLGDYVDGWGQSAQVINFLIDLSERYQCIFLKGNHDACCEEWLKTGRMADSSYLFGGKATMESYESIDGAEKILHIAFLEALKYYEIDEQNRLFVHAGFTSVYGPQKEYYQSNLIWERTLWEMALAMDKNLTRDSPYYPKRLKLFHEIFVGHTPTTKVNIDHPMNIANMWNVDTGAAFRGCLTILNIETKEFFQSDPVYTLYPNEPGREH